MEVKEFNVEEVYKEGHITPQDVHTLREWLKTQPHLPEKYITDLDIILAYHCCNHSTEVTKQLLDLNYSLRTMFASYFKDRGFDATMQATFKNQFLVRLPERSKDGNVVMYTQGIDLEKFDTVNNIRAFLMSIDLWQYETGPWPGFEVILNFDGYGIGLLSKFDLKNVQQFLYYIQEAIPLKLKRVHILNAPNIFDRLLTIIKPFLKVEMLNIIEFHSEGLKSLSKYIPLEVLPKDIGGNYKTIEEWTEDVFKKFQAGKSFFEEENKKRVVESLRPGKPKRYTDIFGGVEGSFKKLEID